MIERIDKYYTVPAITMTGGIGIYFISLSIDVYLSV